LKSLTAMGLGVSILPRSARSATDPAGLIYRRFDGPPLTREIALVRHQRRHLSKGAQIFADAARRRSSGPATPGAGCDHARPARVRSDRGGLGVRRRGLRRREMCESSSVHVRARPLSRVNERLVLLTLAAVQFTHIMDFMIMMPLGPQFMRAFGITPTQFGFLVAIYSASAGVMGFGAGFVMDKFDGSVRCSCSTVDSFWVRFAARSPRITSCSWSRARSPAASAACRPRSCSPSWAMSFRSSAGAAPWE